MIFKRTVPQLLFIATILFSILTPISYSQNSKKDTTGSAAINSENKKNYLQDTELQMQTIITQEKNALEQSDDSVLKKQELEFYTTYLFSVKSKDGNSNARIIESGFDYSYEFKLFDKLPVTFSLGSEYIDIKQNSQVPLPSHLVGLTTGIDVVLPFFNINNTYIDMGVNPSFYSDDWGFESSSFRIPVNNFLIYKPNEKLTFLGGVAVFPDFKNKIFPIIGFIYKPNEKLLINFNTDNPVIAYSLNNKLTVFAQAQLPLGSEFNVKYNDSERKVLIYNDTRLGLGTEYKFNKMVSASLSVGGAFDRYIRYRDIDGKLSIKNGLYTEFAIDIQI